MNRLFALSYEHKIQALADPRFVSKANSKEKKKKKRKKKKKSIIIEEKLSSFSFDCHKNSTDFLFTFLNMKPFPCFLTKGRSYGRMCCRAVGVVVRRWSKNNNNYYKKKRRRRRGGGVFSSFFIVLFYHCTALVKRISKLGKS